MSKMRQISTSSFARMRPQYQMGSMNFSWICYIIMLCSHSCHVLIANIFYQISLLFLTRTIKVNWIKLDINRCLIEVFVVRATRYVHALINDILSIFIGYMLQMCSISSNNHTFLFRKSTTLCPWQFYHKNSIKTTWNVWINYSKWILRNCCCMELMEIEVKLLLFDVFVCILWVGVYSE